MDEAALQEIFDELISSLESLETCSTALLQFLTMHGLAYPDELKPYLEQAANVSEIKSRALRLRIASLVSAAVKPAEAISEDKDAEKIEASTKPVEDREEKKPAEKEVEGTAARMSVAKPDDKLKPAAETNPVAERNESPTQKKKEEKEYERKEQQEKDAA